MESLLRDLAEPFERMTAVRASEVLEELYGIVASEFERLDTERDDTFRVIAEEREYVLKVAHPSDTVELVSMQSDAMAWVARQGLPVPGVIASAGGTRHPVAYGRIVRLLDWVPGTPGMLPREGGEALARLAVALSDFDAPAAHRTFAWDVRQLNLLVAERRPAFTDVVFERMDALAVDALPRQVIHHDFHPGNVLVDESSIVGILDFGDMLYGARVADVAVSLAYLLREQGDPWVDARSFLAGYESVTPLEEREHAAIPTLVAARLVQRIIIPSLLEPDRADIAAAAARTARILDNLLREN